MTFTFQQISYIWTGFDQQSGYWLNVLPCLHKHFLHQSNSIDHWKNSKNDDQTPLGMDEELLLIKEESMMFLIFLYRKKIIFLWDIEIVFLAKPIVYWLEWWFPSVIFIYFYLLFECVCMCSYFCMYVCIGD